MKLNKKIRYGLRAMVEISKNYPKSVLQKDIAKKQKIPLKFLDTIISGLRIRGLIKNYSGKKSGYVLTREPSKISIYDIYLAFEPEISVVECLCEPNLCEFKKFCSIRFFWNDINKTLKEKMLGYTLKDIVLNKIKILKKNKKC